MRISGGRCCATEGYGVAQHRGTVLRNRGVRCCATQGYGILGNLLLPSKRVTTLSVLRARLRAGARFLAIGMGVLGVAWDGAPARRRARKIEKTPPAGAGGVCVREAFYPLNAPKATDHRRLGWRAQNIMPLLCPKPLIVTF